VVNYVENHDNQTLFDINAYKLPTSTSKEDRARVQILGAAINAFSQGVAYFHAGHRHAAQQVDGPQQLQLG
jgi:pullulanase